MMHKSMAGRIGPASVKEDVTLKDYIARKTSAAGFYGHHKKMLGKDKEPKKLTFEEWVAANKNNQDHPVTYFNIYNCGKGDMDQESYFFFSLLWKAAQENK